MADRGVSFTHPLYDSMNAGLRVPQGRAAGAPSNSIGLQNLGRTPADLAVKGQEMLGTSASAQAFETMATRAPKPPARLFSPSTNRIAAGGTIFDATDVAGALQSTASPEGAPVDLPEGDWVPLPDEAYQRYISSLSARRGRSELLGLGARQVGEGIIGGVGSLMELGGATQAGPAVREFAQGMFGQDENEQLRSALIAQNSTLMEQIVDGAWQAVPTVLATLTGAGAVGLGLRAAGAGATAITAGSAAGGAATSFPMHINSFYEAAVRNGLDPNDPEVKTEILGGALTNSALDSFGITSAAGKVVSRALRTAAEQAGKNAARGAIRNTLTGAAKTGFAEALTETTQTLLESTLFDPTVREQLTASDWKALAPYISENYGDDLLISAGVGAVLGGGVGGLAGAVGPGKPKQEVSPASPKDLTSTATEQSAEKEAPSPDLYGQQSFQPLGLPYIPGAETIGARPVAPTGGEQVIDINRPLTLQQVGLMRGATQGLRPEDRTAGNITVPSGERATVLEGEVLPAQRAAPLRRGLPPPPPIAGTLAAPGVSEADFTAGPEGVTPTGAAPAAEPVVTPVTPAQRLRVGAPAATPLLTGQTTDTAIGNQLAAQLAARRAATAQQAADQQAAAEAARQAQLAEGARGAEIEAAYAQREAQTATMRSAEEQAAYDQLSAEQKAYVDADASWETFRPQDGKKQSGVTLRDLAPKAQREWMTAVRNGEADQALYQQLRNRRPVGKAAPLVDVPTILQPKKAAPAPKAPPKPKPLPKKQRDVIARFGGLTPEQQQAVLADLGTDAQGLSTLIASDPAAVDAAIDRAVAPPPPPPAPTKPTGQAAIQRQGAAGATGAAAGVRRGTAGRRRPRAETEAEVEARGIEDDIADLEQSMMPVDAPMEGAKLDAAVDLMSIRDSPDTPSELRNLAQRVLETNSKTSGPAALSVAERAYAARTLASRTGAQQATVQLAQVIDEFNAAPGDFTAEWQTQFRRLVAEVRKTDPEARYGDRSLLSYAKANNDPNFARVDGVRQIVGAPGNFSLASWNTIDGVVDLDGKPVTPVASGRVQLLVRNFVAKLARKPTVTVFRNQADLKAKNPALYARAVAARPQGDFDTAQAMGYSFGDGQVIIFSDRIATEQQLNFVIAHETMGHFGLRGIMPGPKFDALMETLYTSSPAIKTAADAAMSTNPQLSRAEAVEEYLSDYAAVLETNVVARVWNAIRTFLDKLGIRTGNEMTRYILDQSRRYVRYGTGVTFDAGSVGQRLHSVEASGDTGRFSLGPSMRDVNLMAGLQVDSIGGYPMNFEEGWKYFKRQAVNSTESWDKFKSTFLSLANFRARQNPGLLALEKLLDEARNLSMSTKVEFNEKLALVLNRAIAGEVGGISDAQTAKINEMLYAAQRYNVAEVRKLGDLGNVPLFRMENGRLVPTDEVPRLQRLGTRTLEQMRDGFSFEVSFEEAGKTVTKTEKFDGIKGLTKDSIEWRGYQKIRAAMDEIELRLLRARYEGALQERDLAFRQIAATVPDGELTADERSALVELSKTYGDLYTSNVQQDENGRAVLDADYQVYANDILRVANSALIGRAEDRFEALRKLLAEPREFMKGDTDTVRRSLPAIMDKQAADDLVARLRGFKTRAAEKLRQNEYVVQNKIKQIILAELANKDADKFTKRTIATGYTPILREGAYQIRVEATINGNLVRLQDSYREQLVYSQFETAAEAMEMADKTNALFGDNDFEVMYYDPTAGEYKSGKVKLRAVNESALDAVAAPPQLNLNEFIRGLRQFDINLSPEKMEDVIVALTKQNSAARSRLERVFTPGAQMDGVMATMRHIESRASTISKTIVRPRMGELMDRSMSSTMALWNGDQEHLAKLKKRAEEAAADANLSREAKADAQRTYEQYAYMYNQTNPGGGKPRRGNQFYNEAASTVAFLDGNKNVDESDFGSGPMVSRIRAATSMMQLGGSVATGALNVLSVYTNGIPYLSSYNPKTAFGGGFAVGQVVKELHRAAAHVGGPGITSGEMNTAEFYEKVSNSPELQKQYNLKAHEARFIAQEILDGAMIPAQSNALVGTARGRTTQGWQQKFLDGWMWTFNVTEQASRRSLGLTAYRLEFARKQATGMSEAAAAEAARTFAVQTLQYTMGEYSVLNRPPAWRSGIQSFMYMYKVFPTTSVQLFMNMSRNGKVGMLVALWMLTGMTGLPFAEDLEDVIDTLAQKLKVTGWQGARYESAQFIDNIFPGMSPYFLKGIVNQYLPADIAGRTSLGDLLPGTDLLLAGADVSRGLSEIAGPAPAMLIGTAQFAADLLSVPFSTTTTLETAAREAPVTMVRALADAYAYTQSGAVVDRRGYTVSADMNAATILTRALGFYPVAAANQYEMIRMSKRMTDYQREVVTGYRTAWVSAMMRNDREFARQIEESVEDWNAGSKGTALEIKNFVRNSQKALREARRPASERTLRSAPNAAERDLQNMVDIMTLN